MTPIDMDEIANIATSRMQRTLIFMSPIERRTRTIMDAEGCTEEEAEKIALETLEKEPCERP